MTGTTRRDFLIMMAGAGIQPAFALTQTKIDLANIRTRAEWRKAREKILASMQLVMGELPKRKRPPVEIVRLETEDLPRFTRAKIKYLSEEGDYVPAYLLTPKNLKRRAPAMLCLHQTVRIGKAEPVGLGGNPNLHYAKELAERGYVCIAPDYPYLGENNFDPYKHGYISCTMKGIWNHMRAVDVLQSLPEVNPNRIGSIGHSLGGHNTLFVAAFDQRIKAMVTSCGFTSFKKYYNGDLTGWAGKRYMPLIAEKYGKDPARMPFDFSDILIALAPRPLFINAPLGDTNFEVSGVKDCVDVAAPVYEKVFKAKERLVAVYPDAGHDFPAEIRNQAYRFLDQWLV
ncbi:MAG: alpha/beta hydrolase [Blastocatellales bacterium]